MGKGHKISVSNKNGLNSKESYKVTRGNTIYLRILGEDPSYRLVTATASEDDGEFLRCMDRVRLTSAALRFGKEMDTQPEFLKDRSNREFIKICWINIKPGGTSEEDEAELDRVLSRFFEIYDATEPSASSEPTRAKWSKQLNEMREIYQAFAPDDSGDDVYLSDGVWLSSNGSLHDRGR